MFGVFWRLTHRRRMMLGVGALLVDPPQKDDAWGVSEVGPPQRGVSCVRGEMKRPQRGVSRAWNGLCSLDVVRVGCALGCFACAPVVLCIYSRLFCMCAGGWLDFRLFCMCVGGGLDPRLFFMCVEVLFVVS